MPPQRGATINRTALFVFVAALVIAVAVLLLSGPDAFQESATLDTRIDASSVSSSPDEITRTDQGHEANNGTSRQPQRVFIGDDESDRLFTDISEIDALIPEIQAFLAERQILAYRIVEANADELRKNIRESSRIPGFAIRLLDSELTYLVTDSATEHVDGWQSGYATWIGSVDGDQHSRATLFVAPDGAVNGQIRTTVGGRIKIENIPGTGAHLIWTRIPGVGKSPH